MQVDESIYVRLIVGKPKCFHQPNREANNCTNRHNDIVPNSPAQKIKHCSCEKIPDSPKTSLQTSVFPGVWRIRQQPFWPPVFVIRDFLNNIYASAEATNAQGLDNSRAKNLAWTYYRKSRRTFDLEIITLTKSPYL